MIKHVAAATIAAFAALAPLTTARADSVAVRIDGVGAARCSQITTDIKSQPAIVANSVVHWAYGYMTRRNVERGLRGLPQVNIGASVSDQQLLQVILSFCEDKPDARIFQVVDALYEVLLEKGSPVS